MYPLIYNQTVLQDDRKDGPLGPDEPGERGEPAYRDDPSAAPEPQSGEPGSRSYIDPPAWQQAAAQHPSPVPPVQAQQLPADGSVVVDGVTYRPAGFMLRFWAFMIDFVILSLCHALLLALLGYQAPDDREMLDLFSQLMSTLLSAGMPQGELLARIEDLQRVTRIVGWLNVSVCFAYYTIFHTVAGATLGKLCLGLSVLTNRGHRLSFGTASLRYAVRLLLSRLFFGGAITVFFDQRRRTAYDMAAGTNVFHAVSVPPEGRID